MQRSDWTVSATGVSLEYTYFEYKTHSLKEYVMQRLKGHIGRQTVQVLNGVDFHAYAGETIAIIGHNGSGKSTLLRVLAGIIEPQLGKVTVRGRLAPMIELGTGFDPELNGIENIRLSCTLMGLGRREIERKVDSIIEFSELESYMDIPIKNYSSGMQARLGFACTTAVEPEILLVDEVLSVGDSHFAAKCLQRIERLRQAGTTIIVVSHSEELIRSLCSRAYVMSKGRMMFEGAIPEALQQHQQAMQHLYGEQTPA